VTLSRRGGRPKERARGGIAGPPPPGAGRLSTSAPSSWRPGGPDLGAGKTPTTKRPRSGVIRSPCGWRRWPRCQRWTPRRAESRRARPVSWFTRWPCPQTTTGQVEKYDEQVEEIAVRIATAWEQERGAAVQDVGKPALARAAGLADWPGFDLLAR